MLVNLPHLLAHSRRSSSTRLTQMSVEKKQKTRAIYYRSRKYVSDASSVTPSTPGTTVSSPISREFELLDSFSGLSLSYERLTAPLVTRDAFDSGMGADMPQYGLLGSILSVQPETFVAMGPMDKRLYLNTNAPFSAVVCGVQGSGKSHTVGVMLESMLIRDERLGMLKEPLSGLVLHYGEIGGAAQPCEAAYQALSPDPKVAPPDVVVYVAPSSLTTMTKLYSKVFGATVKILPLLFTHDELDAQSVLSMMAVSDKEPPLYVQIILSILRELGESFTFTQFLRRIEISKTKFNPAQLSGLDQRMSLLQSFLQTTPLVKARFRKAQLTIVDLTDPFIDASSACSVFEIVTRLFIRADVGTGKLLVVDEAHKYLSGKGSARLTDSLLSIVRQQRHFGIRTILSTQEPTIIPAVLLDLCNITVMHRFSSISWFEHLSRHVSSEFTSSAFDMVVKLQTGHAIILAPMGMGVFLEDEGSLFSKVACFGRRYLVVKTRRRLTADGGSSVLVI